VKIVVKLEQNTKQEDGKITVERVQIGVRIEKRMVKVLKGLAEYHDISLGDLLEGIVLHAFENKTPFGEATLQCVRQLKEVYGMDYGVSASHRFVESETG
jgi:hypothetical protein